MPSEAQQQPERIQWSLGGDPVTLRSEAVFLGICDPTKSRDNSMPLCSKRCVGEEGGSVINNTIFPKD